MGLFALIPLTLDSLFDHVHAFSVIFPYIKPIGKSFFRLGIIFRIVGSKGISWGALY